MVALLLFFAVAGFVLFFVAPLAVPVALWAWDRSRQRRWEREQWELWLVAAERFEIEQRVRTLSELEARRGG